MDTRGNTPQSQGPDPDELRTAFQQQSRAEVAEGRARQARIARWAGMIASVLLGLGAVATLAQRFGEGMPAGLWTVLCAVALPLTVTGWFLARAGRTRWTVTALVLALAAVQLGDMLRLID